MKRGSDRATGAGRLPNDPGRNPHLKSHSRLHPYPRTPPNLTSRCRVFHYTTASKTQAKKQRHACMKAPCVSTSTPTPQNCSSTLALQGVDGDTTGLLVYPKSYEHTPSPSPPPQVWSLTTHVPCAITDGRSSTDGDSTAGVMA